MNGTYKMTKVDRALEMQVIDWLQWYPWEENVGKKNIPALALEMISIRKKSYNELEVIAGIMCEALVWCDEMLTARDKMNSKVHCAPVRLSPITERVQQALDAYRALDEN